MADGYSLRAVIPGGASTSFVLPEHFSAKMDFESLQSIGSRLGTGTVIAIDDRTCPVGALLNLERFFARESCGWCTPCWGGLQWVQQILQAIEDGEGRLEDLDVLQEHCTFLGPGNTYCALAAGAMEPLQSGLKLFRDVFEQHIREKRCPWS
jgi:NADH-quinone oxidoreductase subunit F